MVGPEWRFRLAPAADVRRPLVPDVAVVPRDGLRGLEGRDLEGPPFGPLVVVEILSPEDLPAHLAHKRDVYFACGTLTMIVVDPHERIVDVYEHTGSVRRFTPDATLTSESFPEMQIALRPMFDAINFD